MEVCGEKIVLLLNTIVFQLPYLTLMKQKKLCVIINYLFTMAHKNSLRELQSFSFKLFDRSTAITRSIQHVEAETMKSKICFYYFSTHKLFSFFEFGLVA